MRMDVNGWLVAAAAMSAMAALLHVAVIVGGPAWYRFFGAGERIARLAEAGNANPVVVTLAIAAMLAVWGAYAAAGAGLLKPLPFTAAALVAIATVYVLRGLIVIPVMAVPALRTPFNVWSSAICLAIGCVHAVGLWQVWKRL